MTEIKGYKRGSQLFFERESKHIVFDFKDLSFYRPLKNGFRKLNSGQNFFRKLTASDVAEGFIDKNYSELIKVVAKAEYRLSNFASLFEKLGKYQHLESYILLGIKFSSYSVFKNPASQFTKEILEFMKESQINFNDSNFENNFIKYPKLFNDIITHVRRSHYLDLEVYRMVHLMLSRSNYYGGFTTFRELVSSHKEEFQRDWRGNKLYGYGCEYKALFDYLVRIDRTEACAFDSAITLYRDYLKMMREMEQGKAIQKLKKQGIEVTKEEIGFAGYGRIEKYPKYLKTRHDIVVKNYNVFQNTHDEEIFKTMVQYGYEYKKGNFMIIAPKVSQDVKNEGVALHHCVASYVSRILDGTTQILFLRQDEEESLVTVEVRANSIVQARGYNNRNITGEEEKFLKVFAKAKNLNYKDVIRDENMPTPPIVALAKYDYDVAFLREISLLVNS